MYRPIYAIDELLYPSKCMIQLTLAGNFRNSYQQSYGPQVTSNNK